MLIDDDKYCQEMEQRREMEQHQDLQDALNYVAGGSERSKRDCHFFWDTSSPSGYLKIERSYDTTIRITMDEEEAQNWHSYLLYDSHRLPSLDDVFKDLGKVFWGFVYEMAYETGFGLPPAVQLDRRAN